MQGYKFVVLSRDGRPTDHGIILQQITPERYLCQFAKAPSKCRVCRIEQIEGWNLFPDDDLMNAFIAATVKPAPPPPKKKPRKKAAKKKVKREPGVRIPK